MQVKSYQTAAEKLITFIPHLAPTTDDLIHLALHYQDPTKVIKAKN